MRRKELRLVVSFETAAAAMAMERYCLEHDVPGRLIPTPRQITANCGLAWSAPADARERVESAMNEAGIPAAALSFLEL